MPAYSPSSRISEVLSCKEKKRNKSDVVVFVPICGQAKNKKKKLKWRGGDGDPQLRESRLDGRVWEEDACGLACFTAWKDTGRPEAVSQFSAECIIKKP